MDRLDAMRVFTRIVEQRSFSEAASDLGLPRSTVTDAVKQLEARLGVRLLQRTTRHVSPTLDGEAYYRRCLAILADVEDAEGAFSGVKPKGLLRIDVQGTLARYFLLPSLPAFLTEYPDIELFMGEGDRLVDLLREGVDCVLRVGQPRDSDMVARHIADLEEVTCAAPAYLARHGLPQTPAELEAGGHRMVGFRSSVTGVLMPLEFRLPDGKSCSISLPATFSVNGAQSYSEACRLGLGIIQAPRYHLERDIAEGRLVELLPGYCPAPSPVSLLYPQNRQLSPRVRVFIDWATRQFRAASAGQGAELTLINAGPLPKA